MKVNFTTRSIILSAKEMKNASKPNTIEYKELLSVMKDLPDFVIEVNHPHITRNANRGLTYEAMMQYITRIAPNRLEEFKNVVYLGGYLTVKQGTCGREQSTTIGKVSSRLRRESLQIQAPSGRGNAPPWVNF